jgi:hypothetical protein
MTGAQQSAILKLQNALASVRGVGTPLPVTERGTYIFTGVTVSFGGGRWDIPSVRSFPEDGPDSLTFPGHSAFDAALFADKLFQRQQERDDANPVRAASYRTGHLNPRIDASTMRCFGERRCPLCDSSHPTISSRRLPERTAHSPWNFVLQLPPSEIPALVKRRLTNVDETKSAEAGRRIAAGDYSRANLRAIVAWKNKGRWLDRVLLLLDQNSEQDIEGALRVAAMAPEERTAIAALCGLKGVGVPTASAIMTEIKPERYTIIDVNALKSLGVPDDLKDEVDYYVAYLRKCRELASKFAVSLREIDHALWQWGHEH